ncbi:cupin [Patescibacteria group bacterium]|nr:cupin [Patescibacteria group bacterium]
MANNSFSTKAYSPIRIEKPWGYEIHWTPPDKPYMGKILHINKGARLSLQKHDQKQESWYLLNGKAGVIWENENGELIETEFEMGKAYNCQINQKHRLFGITDCDIMEVSTPEIGITFRLEDDYKRTDETEEVRKRERS